MSIKRVPPRITKPPAIQTSREGSFTRNGTTNKSVLSGRPKAATPKK